MAVSQSYGNSHFHHFASLFFSQPNHWALLVEQLNKNIKLLDNNTITSLDMYNYLTHKH